MKIISSKVIPLLQKVQATRRTMHLNFFVVAISDDRLSLHVSVNELLKVGGEQGFGFSRL